MATIHELFDSRASTEGQESPSATLRYMVRGTDTDTEVDSLVASTLPAIYNGKYFQDYKKTPLGGQLWEVEARYGKKEQKEDGDWELLAAIEECTALGAPGRVSALARW